MCGRRIGQVRKNEDAIVLTERMMRLRPDKYRTNSRWASPVPSAPGLDLGGNCRSQHEMVYKRFTNIHVSALSNWF